MRSLKVVLGGHTARHMVRQQFDLMQINSAVRYTERRLCAFRTLGRLTSDVGRLSISPSLPYRPAL